jgi:signal recognition particle subunit SRP54
VNKLRHALQQQKQMMKQMGNMSEKDMEKMSKNPSSMMKPLPPKKGKGKNKGRFRF